MSDLNDQRTPEVERGNVVDPRTRWRDLPQSVKKRWLAAADATGGVRNGSRADLTGTAQRLWEQAKQAVGMGGDDGNTTLTERSGGRFEGGRPQTGGGSMLTQEEQPYQSKTSGASISQEEMYPEHVLFKFEKGSRNTQDDRVRTVQDQLQKLDYNIGDAGVDGWYGEDTSRAVRQFQERTDGLDPTGNVDMKTMAALREQFVESRQGN